MVLYTNFKSIQITRVPMPVQDNWLGFAIGTDFSINFSTEKLAWCGWNDWDGKEISNIKFI